MVGDPFNSADPLIGRKLDGRYEVLERLGEGGAGVVYRGRQTHLGRFVAIKVLHQDTASSTEWRRRFQREAIALSVLAHPNVVPVTDFGVDHGVPFLVMELLEGQTLGALIKEGPLPLWRALEIARQTLRVLAFSHIKGVVHRDLKPTNVFLQALPDQADHVRLLDFGMAKFVEGSSSRAPAELTRAGVMIGTPAYMSPEQVKGAPTDARTDVYAAGLLLFELLAGRRPFVADSPEGYLAAHLTAPVPSLAKLRPGLAHASLFQAVVERAMAKKPAERFEDAYAMVVALEDVVARLPAAVVSGGRAEARRKPMPRARSAAPSGSRFWRRVMLLVTLAVGIAAVEEYLRHEGAKQAKTTGVPAAQPPKPALSSPTPPKPALPAAQARTATQPSPPPTPPAPSLPSPEPEPPTSPPVKVQAPMDPEPPERPAQPQITMRRPPKVRAIRGESLFPGLSDRSGTGSSAACTCPSGRLSLRTSSRARIPTTRAHGSYSERPTHRSIGSGTRSNGTSGPTRSIQPVAPTRRCSRICSRLPRIRSLLAAPRGPSATSTASRRFPPWSKLWSTAEAIARPPHASPGCASRFRTEVGHFFGRRASTKLAIRPAAIGLRFESTAMT